MMEQKKRDPMWWRRCLCFRDVLLCLSLCGVFWPSAVIAKRYVLAVGINQYQDRKVQELRYAQRDAGMLARVLKHVGRVPASNVTLLLGYHATKASILGVFRRWARQMTPKDEAVFFFSGHGFSANSVSYLMPYDASATASRQSLSHLEINAWTLRWKAKAVIVLLDACHSGFASRGKPVAKLDVRAFQHTGGRVVIASSPQHRSSLEARRLGHGVFSSVLLQGLLGRADVSGDGVISLWELWRDLRTRLPMTSRQFGLLQRPVFFGTMSQRLVMSFVGKWRSLGRTTRDFMLKEALPGVAGDVVFVGGFSGKGQSFGRFLQSRGRQDVLVVSVDKDRKTRWLRQIGGPGMEEATGAARANNGNVWVAGMYDQDHRTVPRARGLFVAHLDKAGRRLWLRRFPVQGLLSSVRIAALAHRRSVLVGSFSGTLRWGRHVLKTHRRSQLFVAMLDAYGRISWLRTMEGSFLRGFGMDVASDGRAQVVIAAQSTQEMRIDTLRRWARVITVAKLNRAGRFLWATQLQGSWQSTPPMQSPIRVMWGGRRTFYISGSFRGKMQSGEWWLRARGPVGRFAGAITERGKWRWLRAFGERGASVEGSALYVRPGSGTLFLGAQVHGGLRLYREHARRVRVGTGPLLLQLSTKGKLTWHAIVNQAYNRDVAALWQTPQAHLCLLGTQTVRLEKRKPYPHTTTLLRSWLWELAAPRPTKPLPQR